VAGAGVTCVQCRTRTAATRLQSAMKSGRSEVDLSPGGEVGLLWRAIARLSNRGEGSLRSLRPYPLTRIASFAALRPLLRERWSELSACIDSTNTHRLQESACRGACPSARWRYRREFHRRTPNARSADKLLKLRSAPIAHAAVLRGLSAVSLSAPLSRDSHAGKRSRRSLLSFGSSMAGSSAELGRSSATWPVRSASAR